MARGGDQPALFRCPSVCQTDRCSRSTGGVGAAWPLPGTVERARWPSLQVRTGHARPDRFKPVLRRRCDGHRCGLDRGHPRACRICRRNARIDVAIRQPSRVTRRCPMSRNDHRSRVFATRSPVARPRTGRARRGLGDARAVFPIARGAECGESALEEIFGPATRLVARTGARPCTRLSWLRGLWVLLSSRALRKSLGWTDVVLSRCRFAIGFVYAFAHG